MPIHSLEPSLASTSGGGTPSTHCTLSSLAKAQILSFGILTNQKLDIIGSSYTTPYLFKVPIASSWGTSSKIVTTKLNVPSKLIILSLNLSPNMEGDTLSSGRSLPIHLTFVWEMISSSLSLGSEAIQA